MSSDPMKSIRDHLWGMAELMKGSGDLAFSGMHDRARQWALDVAEAACMVFDEDSDLELLADEAITAFREYFTNDFEHEEHALDNLQRLTKELNDAVAQSISDEIFDECLPLLAAERAALAALRSAVQDYDVSDLRAVAAILTSVPEHASLSLAYNALDREMDDAGIETQQRANFILRESNDRVGDVIGSCRERYGDVWFKRLTHHLYGDAGPSLDIGEGSAFPSR